MGVYRTQNSVTKTFEFEEDPVRVFKSWVYRGKEYVSGVFRRRKTLILIKKKRGSSRCASKIVEETYANNKRKNSMAGIEQWDHRKKRKIAVIKRKSTSGLDIRAALNELMPVGSQPAT